MFQGGTRIARIVQDGTRMARIPNAICGLMTGRPTDA